MGDSKTNLETNHRNTCRRPGRRSSSTSYNTPSRRIGDSKTNHQDQQLTGLVVLNTPSRMIPFSHVIDWLPNDIDPDIDSTAESLPTLNEIDTPMDFTIFPSQFERSASYYVSQYGRNLHDTPLPQVLQSYNNLRLNAVDHMDTTVVEVENDNIRSLRDATATGSDPEELLVVVD